MILGGRYAMPHL